MELLNVRHLRKVYNTKLGFAQCVALKDVSFDVEEGEFAAIMGASGSGKSTLLNLLASLDKPTSGEILLDGAPFARVKDRDLAAFRRDRLGFVFQDFNLLDTFTLRDNILLPLVLQQTKVDEMEARLMPLSARLGIADILGKYPFEVSGGQKQRAAVARALITKPRILLADEPTGALDSRSSTSLMELFSSLNGEGITILMVTHSPQAASYAGRVLMISDGEIHSQLYRGELSRRDFLSQVLAALAAAEGERNE